MVVAGTGTEVGKTWVARQLLQLAKARGLTVAARKPAQSFSPDGGPTDAELLAAVSGEPPEIVCPRNHWYAVPMAPPMAADVLGRPPLQLDTLLAQMVCPLGTDFALVETAGGVLSPLTHDADNVDLIRRLGPREIVLVADAGLGTLNSVRLSLQALREWPVTVLLNRYDSGNDLHRRNLQWLVERDGVAAITDAAQWWARREPVEAATRSPGTTPDPPSRD